ncbi:MAG: DUF4440 domain-containing protein [Verrucomicrobiota bacterium]
MKSLTALIAITAIGFAASAWAQEEEATATPIEEQSATTIEETPAAPAPAPAVETTPAPSAPTKAEPTSSPAAKSPKVATPAASPTKASSAATAAAPMPSGKKMSVEASIKDNENRWAAAALKRDMAAVQILLADDFIGINSKGKVQNRRALMGEMKGDKDTYTSTKNEKMDVHKFGNNVAVVVGTYHEKGTGKDTKAFDRSYRFSDTWVERNGQWRCVASQSIMLGKR